MSFVRFLATESKHLYDTDIKSVLTWIYDLFVKVEESKRPRDSRPLLKQNEHCEHGYEFKSLHMASLGKDRFLLSNPTHCRDYFNEIIRYYATGGRTNSYHIKTALANEEEFDRDYLRLALFLDVESFNNISPIDGIRKGLRLANMYGSIAGWRRLRCVQCRMKNEKDFRSVYVVLGDKNWQRTP